MKKRKVGIIGTIITVVILVLLVIVTTTDNSKFFHIENIVSKIVIPIENGLTYLKNKIEGNGSFFEEVSNLQTRNEELEARNDELESKVAEIEVLKAENQNLKEAMNIADIYKNHEVIPGYLISKDFSNYSSNIIINVGKEQGVQENMVVVEENGVVGHVISVTNNSAKVQILVDPVSQVSASINQSAETLVCTGVLGDRNKLKGIYIEADQQVSVGDSIETSGIGGIYPKGLEIGEIVEVVGTKNLTDRYVMIQTKVDFENLENVAVIK